MKKNDIKKELHGIEVGLIMSMALIIGDGIARMVIYKKEFIPERKITFYNLTTGEVVLDIEGHVRMEKNDLGDASIFVKVGPKKYIKSNIFLGNNIGYVITEISKTHSDPYYYSIYRGRYE